MKSNGLQDVLCQNEGSYVLPFFWQHGEDEDTLREYMEVIYKANIREVCVESRPHPDFCGPKWWEDMDVILEEARKRGMKVWVLDDSHFPTGYANGAAEQAPDELCHQYIAYNKLQSCGPIPACQINVEEYMHPLPLPKFLPQPSSPKRIFHDDEPLAVIACRIGEEGEITDTHDLMQYEDCGTIQWDMPEGYWEIYLIYLTRNGDGRNDYINFLDKDSCRLLIDAVYEKHYERYKSDFGGTLAGFFSDEPPVGNTSGYTLHDQIGKTDMVLPWSKAMPGQLNMAFGSQGWKEKLPLLWHKGKKAETAHIRHAYMESVTRLVEQCFSGQIGEWCKGHGVEYIGQLMRYTNRVCHLINSGRSVTNVALLYYGESSWAGGYDSNTFAARELSRNQIDFHIIPSDVFAEPEKYQTSFGEKCLQINGNTYYVLLISGCDYLAPIMEDVLMKAAKHQFPIWFLDRYPMGLAGKNAENSGLWQGFSLCATENLAKRLCGKLPGGVRLGQSFPELSVYPYQKDDMFIFLVLNEHPYKVYEGEIKFPVQEEGVYYNPWDNTCECLNIISKASGYSIVKLRIEPLETQVFVFGQGVHQLAEKDSLLKSPEGTVTIQLEDFEVSMAESKAYPCFEKIGMLHTPVSMAVQYPDFSGYYQYCAKAVLQESRHVVLHFEQIYDSCEIWVNGQYAGSRVSSPYRIDITELIHEGENEIRIEVATTLERKVHSMGNDIACMNFPAPMSPTGIVGKVWLTTLPADKNHF